MKPIVPNDKCLTQEQILRYLRDDCQPDEVRSIDKHLTHCPMCSDAMEGAMMLDTKELEFAWAQSQAQIKARTEELTTPVTHLKTKRSKSARIFRFTFGMVASIALLAVAAIWLLTKPLDKEASQYDIAETPQSSTADSAYFTQQPVVLEPSSAPTTAKPDANAPSTKSDVASAEAPRNSKYASPIADTNAMVTSAPIADVPMEKKPITESSEKIGDYANARTADIESKKAKEVEYKEETLKKRSTQPSAMPSKAKAYSSPVSAADDKLVLDNATTLLRNNQYNEAFNNFNTIINKTPKSSQYEQALWYYANALLTAGNRPVSKATYQRIAREKGKYAAQAEEILSKWKD